MDRTPNLLPRPTSLTSGRGRGRPEELHYAVTYQLSYSRDSDGRDIHAVCDFGSGSLVPSSGFVPGRLRWGRLLNRTDPRVLRVPKASSRHLAKASNDYPSRRIVAPCLILSCISKSSGSHRIRCVVLDTISTELSIDLPDRSHNHTVKLWRYTLIATWSPLQ